MILAVTHPGDDHAPRVLEALARRGAEALVLDLAELPRRGWLSLGHGPGLARTLALAGRAPLDLERVRAVWWRRPRPMVPRDGLSLDEARHAVGQTTDALMGALASLSPRALLVNDPWRDHLASHKTLQLARAQEAGLRLPGTLVTSDPEAGRAFLAGRAEGGVVHKAVLASAADWRRTARVGPGDLARLAERGLAPVILQERIEGVDVRATMVGEEMFAAEIDARASASPDDYRGYEDGCRFAPCALPAAVEAALRRLAQDLGLHFAAADFRRRDDGAWFFLELNPAGQWDFVEDRTGQPITEALAALLAGAPHP